MHIFQNIASLVVAFFFILLIAGCSSGRSTQKLNADVALVQDRAVATRSSPTTSNSNLLLLARDIESRGSAATALPLYQRAVNADETNADAHVALAGALIKVGRDAEGAKAYRRALLIDPNHAQALFGLGSVVLRSDEGTVEEGLELLSKAATRLNTAEVHDRLGVAYILAEQPRRALASFETAYRLNDKDIDIATNLALVAALLGQRDRSVALVRRALKHPDVEAYHRRNLILILAIAATDNEAEVAASKFFSPEEIKPLLKLAAKIRQIPDPNDRAKAVGIARIAARG